jgi:hypothetical protein
MPTWRYQLRRQVNNEPPTTELCALDTLPYPFHEIRSFLVICREIDLQVTIGLTTYRLSTRGAEGPKQEHDERSPNLLSEGEEGSV